MFKSRSLIRLYPKGLYKLVGLLWSLVLFMGCESEFDRYYKTSPDDLGSPIIEQLKKDPDYSSFLAALQRSGLDKYISKGGVYTVFAPTNHAFESYEAATGKKVLEMNPEELSNLLSYHVAYGLHYEYSFNSDCRKSGLSSYDTRWLDLVNHQLKRVSIFPARFFGKMSDKDYSSDYQEIYGTGFENTFNVDGVPVIADKMDIDCENGTLHGIGGVLIPPLRLDSFFTVTPGFERYGEILARFDTLVADPDNTYTNEEGVLVEAFKKQYTREKYSLGTNPADESTQVTAFVPTNQAIENFFADVLPKYGDSYENIPDDIFRLILRYNMSKGKRFKTDMPLKVYMLSGDPVYRIKDLLKNPGRPVSNGIVYTLDHLLAPPELGSVTGVVMLDPDFSYMKYALQYTGVLNIVAKNTKPGPDIIDGERENIPVGYTLFAVPNSAWEAAGVDPYNMEGEEGKKQLRSILEYLVIPDSVYALNTDYKEYGKGIEARQFHDGYFKTLNGTYMAKKGNQLIGGDTDNPITLSSNEVHAFNGTVHILDKLLMGPDATQKLYDILGANPDCSIVFEELENNMSVYSDLITDMKDRNAIITFFCPSDAAISAYNSWAAANDGYKTLSEMEDEEKVLFFKSQMVRKRIFQGAFFEDQTLWTVAGRKVVAKNISGELVVDDLNPLSENATAIGQKNDQAVNGVLQPIDHVLLPLPATN